MKIDKKIIKIFIATFFVYFIEGGTHLDNNFSVYYISYLRNFDESANF